MGTCFTPEDDEKLARGWPYLIVPVDGRNEDKTSASAIKAWMASDPVFFTEWPRKTLHRFMHASMRSSAGDETGWKAALENDAPPTAAESLDGLRNLFRNGGRTYPFNHRDVVWGVEAIAGTDATLDAIVSEIEAEQRVTDSTDVSVREAVAGTTAFLLLRASPAAAKRARQRLERVFSAPRDATIAGAYDDYFDTIDCALHGAPAVKRFYAKWAGRVRVWLEVPALYCAASLDLAVDDPSYIRETITANPKFISEGMSVRVAALGGPEVLAALPKRKWPARQMLAVVRDLGMIRAPEIVTFMASLVGKSSAKDAPINWLRAHADYARPVLEKAKTDAAKLVLRQLA